MADELSRVQAVLKSQFNPASLTGSYQALNGSGFSDNAKVVYFYNPSSTISVDLSLDGINDHAFLPPGGTIILDFQTNHYDGPIYGAGTLNVAAGQIIYGKLASQPTYIQIVGFR